MKKRIAILLSLAMVLSPMTPFAKGPLAPVTAYAASESVETLEELKEAVANGDNPITIGKYIYIDTTVSLDLNGATLKADTSFNDDGPAGDGGTRYLFTIRTGGNLIIKNAKIEIEDNNNIGAINLTGDSGADLDNVTIDGGKVGINIGNGTNSATLNKVTVTNSSWGYGVGVNGTSILTVGDGGLKTDYVMVKTTAKFDNTNWEEDPADSGIFVSKNAKNDELIAEAKELEEAKLGTTGLPLYFNVAALTKARQNLESANDKNINRHRETLQDIVNDIDSNSRQPLADAMAEAVKFLDDNKGSAPAYLKAVSDALATAQTRLEGTNINQAGRSEDALRDAMDALTGEIKDSYDALVLLIETAEKIALDDFDTTKNPAKKFITALGNAIAARDAEKIGQANYSKRTSDLQTEMVNLKGVAGDKEELKALLEAIEGKIDDNDYTNYYGSLRTETDAAVAKAVVVRDDEYSSAEVIKAAFDALEAVSKKLISKTELIEGYGAKAKATLSDAVYGDYAKEKLYFATGELDAAIAGYNSASDKVAAYTAIQKLANALVSKVALATMTVDAGKAIEDVDLKETFLYLVNLEEAIGKAAGLLTDTTSYTKQELNKTVNALNKALTELEDAKEAFETLTDLIAEAGEAKKVEGFVPTQAFTKALAAAEAAVENNDTKINKYNSCITNLQTALENIVPIEDNDILTKARDAKTNKDLYFEPSIGKLVEAVDKIDAAQTVEARDKLVDKLEPLVTALVPIAELENELASATEASKGGGSPFYLAALGKAMSSANATLSSNRASAAKKDTEITKLQVAVANLEEANEKHEELSELIDEANQISPKTAALTRIINAATKALEQNIDKMDVQIEALKAAGVELSEDDDNKDDDNKDDDDNNNGSVNFTEVGKLGTSLRLVLEGETSGITVVIVKVSGSKETYTYSTATTVILPKGATCYAVNLSVDVIKANVTGISFETDFAANIQAKESN